MGRAGKLSGVTREQLLQLYEHEGLASEAIARHLGCTPSAVTHLMKRLGIQARTNREAQLIRNAKNPPSQLHRANRATLDLMYHTLRMTADEVARYFRCGETTVYRHFKKHGIEVRSLSESKKVWSAHSPQPRGAASPRFKHGLASDGYPHFSVNGKQEKVHRTIARQVLRRPLASGEVVHHCNEIRTDNRPENLWVFPSHSAHRQYHATGAIHPDTMFLEDYMAQNGEEEQ
jgi:hypothetical protein